MISSELHLDGSREDKLFAPGYGEFRTSGGGDLEALHAKARDAARVAGDVVSLELIRDRFAHSLDPAERRRLNEGLHDLRAASDAGNVAAAADHAARLAAGLRV